MVGNMKLGHFFKECMVSYGIKGLVYSKYYDEIIITRRRVAVWIRWLQWLQPVGL